MSHRLLLPSFLFVLAACAAPGGAPPAPVVDEAAIRSEIEAREREWSAAYLAGDAAGVANLYTEDGAQVEASGEWRRGREAIAAGMKAQLDTLNVTAREDVPEEVIVAGDYVVEIGRYSTTATSKTDNKSADGAGRYMVVWRKDADGIWRLHRDIGSEAPKPKM
ncbi:MAG TPA: SgcJ/EcaC family oxidoreductase [Gemmatimonadaceae bacterium]